MKTKAIVLIWLAVSSLAEASLAQQLEQIFQHPPQEAKPRGYWLWAHGNYDYATIQSELAAFEQAGIGGVDIFDMGIADRLDQIPPGNTFMGDEMMDGIVFALNQAKELGLDMGLSVSNGWNAGGDWTPGDEKLMRLLFWSDTLAGPQKITELGFPKIPTTFEKPYGSYDLFPAFDENGFPEYYENVALVAYPMASNSLVEDTDQIIYFDTNDIDGNNTNVELPAGNWILQRAVVTPLGQKMWMRSDRSNGFIMDHYSKQATKNHFEYIINKLESRMGDLGHSALERLYLASFEAEDYVIWSPELREAFSQHHGYQIDPYIPVFSGLTVKDRETTERFLHDYRTTVSEMFVNNHYRQASGICRDHGILLASESGGPGPPLHYVPTEDSKALGAVDIMRGEFWNNPKRWDDRNGNNLLQVVKNIGSAAHTYGHQVVEMEAFTSQRKHWQESPFELKALADRAFCEGMTRVVYHTMPHSPPEAGVPGWSYQAGTHIHPKMTWWPMIKAFNQYLARCGAMLMQGHFVADVAYYKGGHIPNFSTTKYIRPDLGFGYDYDDLNTEILLQITEVKNGRIVLPSGMEYEILVLPEGDKMELPVLQKIEELLKKGATVIGPKPSRTYGLADYQEKEQQLNELADKIWGRSSKKTDKAYGQGRIIYGKTAREVLKQSQVFPDLQVLDGRGDPNIDFIHRTTAAKDLYFIRNTDSLSSQVKLKFRAKGVPELWHPESGKIQPVMVFTQDETGTTIPLQLHPFASVFLVFDKASTIPYHIKAITTNGETVFPAVSNLADGVLVTLHDQQFTLTGDVSGTYLVEFSGGEKVSLSMDDPEAHLIEGSWQVRFPAGWGVATDQTFDTLSDWTSFADPDLKHFSGIATYRKTFTVEPESIDHSSSWVLDLGSVGEVATVYLNGTALGHSIFPPHKLEIADQLKPGDNFLVIEVANTWKNRLIIDSQLPLKQQLTHSNLSNSNDPQDRPWKDMTPSTSGLIGPVKLIKQHQIEINP
jgi:hypothetical protein